MNNTTSIFAAGLIFATVFPSVQLHALPARAGVELTPHRAIYDLQLRSAEPSANVTDLTGRLVLDFTGSACAGYTYKSRLVTQMTDQDGGTFTSDMRTSTWEDARGEEFRFENIEYNGVQQTSITSGSASRKEKGSIAVSFETPASGEVEFERTALFPTQHSLAILEAAFDGKQLVQADVYDGSEEGKKLYSTTTFIGRPLEPASGKMALGADIENAPRLNATTSWPISISFFDTATSGQRDEGLPTYELAFRLFANGVSGDLTINYGDFLIGGKLTRVDFTSEADCPRE
ncbi:MAG: cell envelope integrity EipB family protein [Hyphomicrobiales bacterium]|nr:cell envelope integrity EipB family protein [Hyphomicrobiales bacterium]